MIYIILSIFFIGVAAVAVNTNSKSDRKSSDVRSVSHIEAESDDDYDDYDDYDDESDDDNDYDDDSESDDSESEDEEQRLLDEISNEYRQHQPLLRDRAYFSAVKHHQSQCHPRGGFIQGSGLHYDRRYRGY